MISVLNQFLKGFLVLFSSCCFQQRTLLPVKSLHFLCMKGKTPVITVGAVKWQCCSAVADDMFSETIIISAPVLAPASIVSLVKPQCVCASHRKHTSVKQTDMRLCGSLLNPWKMLSLANPCAQPPLRKGPAKTFPSTTAQEVQSEVPTSASLLHSNRPKCPHLIDNGLVWKSRGALQEETTVHH